VGKCDKLPQSLQDRLWASWFKNSNRGGWLLSLFAKEKRARCEEGVVSKWGRVVSISILKSDDFRGHRDSPFDGFVYNFEVEGLHTYIVEGVVVHNCHHIQTENKWGLATSLFPNAKGLGVTATPQRADGGGLGRHADGVFDTMVIGPAMRDLIDAGFLSEYRIFAPPSDLDLSGVKISATTGDYSAPALTQATRRSHIMGDVVSHYLKIAKGKRGITFATDVQSAKDIADQFNQAGVPALALDGKTPAQERSAALRKFKRGELLQIVNCDLFGEGFDLPAIEVVSMARATQSYGMYVQVFGRALRLMEGKTHAIIIDHVGNVVRHGLPDAPRTWSLDRRDRKAKAQDPDVIPVKACPTCAAVYERIYPECPYCGFKPKVIGRVGPELVDGDLCEMSEDVLAEMRGAVAKVDMSPADYSAELAMKHCPPIGIAAGVNRHKARQEAQADLRDKMAWWMGHRKAEGDSMQVAQRRFYHRFGVDVMTAQALGTSEALELARKVESTY